MKTGKGGKAERLAYGAVGAAVALVGILLSYYVNMMTLTFNLIAVLGIAIPLFKKYYREAALAAIAVIIVGFFWVNVKVVGFTLIGGAYAVVTVFAYDKGWNKWLMLAFKFLYSLVVFFLIYKLFALISLNLSALKLDGLDPAVLYLVLNAVFSVAFLIYDACLLEGVRFLRIKLKFL